jgi:xylitol oxidase
VSEKLLNWAGNHTFQASRIHRPTSVGEVQEIVAGATKVKAAGTRHSFGDIADTEGDLISVEGLSGIYELTEPDNILVEAGARYGDVSRFLSTQGFALANMASLPHITVGGSVATGTHGSGVKNPSLSAAVRELSIVKPDGSWQMLKRGRDAEFEGAVVGLGALGVVVSLRLDIVPDFQVGQTIYEKLAWQEMEDDLDTLLSGAYSVSLFHRWASEVVDQVWVKRTSGASGADYFGAKKADGPRHPLLDMPTENCTPQEGVYGPAFERLPHFRMEFTPSSGEELQAEYLMPRRHAFAAMKALDAIRDRIAPLLWVSEIRTVAADDLWMSPSYGEDAVAFHFTWRQMVPEVMALLPEIEARLAPFGARPHWGKLFTMGAERIRSLYPRSGDFVRLAEEFDPSGKFRNPYLERHLFG